MKLQHIEEIVTYKVPVWQPALLIIVLLLGIILVPRISQGVREQKKTEPPPFNFQLNSQLFKSSLPTDVKSYIKPYAYKLQKGVESVLGVAQQSAVDIASQSAKQAQEYVFDAAFGKVLQSVQSLPQGQQELIKKAICK